MSRETEEFIRTFEEIAAEVNRRAALPNSFSVEIQRASERDSAVRKHRTLLIYIRELRNALQHPRHRSEGPPVHITPSFLEEVQNVLRYLKNPPTAAKVGVPRQKMIVAHLTDRLGDLADQMRRGGFSHLPVLDGRGAVIGVFNEAAVFDHLWADVETIVGRDMTVADIFPHCSLDAGHTESFRFVRPGTPLDDLVAMFLAIESPSTRVGAAFVTASGQRSEPLQRLITPWDVLASSAT